VSMIHPSNTLPMKPSWENSTKTIAVTIDCMPTLLFLSILCAAKPFPGKRRKNRSVEQDAAKGALLTRRVVCA
jgi:hypothetical protein